jgi:hypothetical protein
MIYGTGNPGPGLGQAHKCGRIGSEDILLSAEAMFTNLTDNLKSSGAAAVYDDTEWRIGIPLTSLILPHLCACPLMAVKNNRSYNFVVWY